MKKAIRELLDAAEAAVTGLDEIAEFMQTQLQFQSGMKITVRQGGFSLTKRLKKAIEKAKEE